ncbi:MAG: FeoB-associated Cys-rich membrane protein [Acutalibacteraceae bacterium]
MSWLYENLGTIIVGAVILSVVLTVIIKPRVDKKKGIKSGGCGCNCSNCPNSACSAK